MAEEWCSLVFFARKVLYHQVVSVDINRFIAYQKLFIIALLVISSKNCHIGITDIKLIIPQGDELKRFGFTRIEFDQEKADLAPVFVAEKVELLGFKIHDDVEKQTDLKQLIKVYFAILVEVDPDTIITRSNDKDSLLSVATEMYWRAF